MFKKNRYTTFNERMEQLGYDIKLRDKLKQKKKKRRFFNRIPKPPSVWDFDEMA